MEEIKYTFSNSDKTDFVELFYDGNLYYYKIIVHNKNIGNTFYTMTEAFKNIQGQLDCSVLKVVSIEITNKDVLTIFN